jgi:outer membrane protein
MTQLRRHLGPLLAALAVLLVPALAGMLAPSLADAADLRVGYVNSSLIFDQFQDARDAQQKFDRQVQGWRDEAAEKENLVKKLRTESRDQSPILSSVKRQEKEEALQRAVSDYERYIQDVWGPGGRAAQENQNATNQIVQTIRSAVEKVAADKGLTLVLDSASGFIIYADRSMDLTSDVLQELTQRSTTSPTNH